MSPRTIIFIFAGRRPNMEVQLPFIRRILQQNPSAEFHIWNLARTPADNHYIRTISDDRITVFNDLYGRNPWRRFNDIYRHYAHPQFQDYRFVKIDDDVIFIETDRFDHFTEHIRPDTITSAQVINNGAATKTIPALWNRFEQLNAPLLDVHRNTDYARMCHMFFFDHWPTIINQPIETIPTDDWLSINLIGYDWVTATKFGEQLGTPSPQQISGRTFRPNDKLGDEGFANTMPRTIMQGFTACHLTFGPQLAKLGEAPFDRWRERYAEIGQKYLCSP